MIAATGYEVEYAVGAFEVGEESRDAIIRALRFVQVMPSAMQPALGVTTLNAGYFGSTSALSLKLFVVVRESDDSKERVKAFLTHFERLYKGKINTQYRTIDGQPAP